MRRTPPSRLRPLLTAGAVFLAALTAPLPAQDLLAEFEARTTTHVLDNGWTFLIVERPVAPVFSFATVVDVGAAQEVAGITGLAHMFEHMAFKGTTTIGTTDYEAEKVVLREVEAAYQAYQRRRLSPRADPEEVAALAATFRARQEAAAAFATNEYPEIVTREGGVGLNAGTDNDMTTYLYSLPANKLELFAFLESERFLHPVFREFYKERDVVQEERRGRVESRPLGRLMEHALATAFVAHPYQRSVAGHMSDLQSFTASDAEAFFRTYYVPSNMVTAIVGQVQAERVIPLLETYFGRFPSRPHPPPLRTVEPPQIAEKTVLMVDPSQPVYLEMYHKPSALHPDEAVYEAIHDVVSNGRTSRLYRSLVRDRKIAASVASFSFPGGKYPNLWAVRVMPAKGYGNEEVRAAIRAELERLKSVEISDAELRRFRTRAKADLIRGLGSNSDLAVELARNQTLHGDWRELFRHLERIDKVTKADVMRVARETFRAANRTVAEIVTETPQPADPAS